MIRGGARNNPRDPTLLTEQQKRMSVTLVYVNTSTFKVHFEATGDGNKPRRRANLNLKLLLARRAAAAARGASLSLDT